MAYKMTFLSKNESVRNYLDFSSLAVTSTRQSNYLIPNIKVNSFWGEKSFKYKAVLQWLQLPGEITNNLISFKIFKKKLMSHVLSIQSTLYDTTAIHENTCDYSCIDDVVNACYC